MTTLLARPGPPAGRRVRGRGGAARWLGIGLVAAGTACLLVIGYVLGVSNLLADRASQSAAGTLEDRWKADLGPPVDRPQAPVTAIPAPARGTAFAVLRLPRFGPDWQRPVWEGTARRDLARGVGHYRGTALPGGIGNVAIFGHRAGHGEPFADIDALREGDLAIIDTAQGRWTYRVARHRIIEPDDHSALAPVPDHPEAAPQQRWLTLIACEPRYGNSHRWVVYAGLVSFRPR
jgi:sortase A